MGLCDVMVVVWYGHQIRVPAVAHTKMLQQCGTFSSERGNNTGMNLSTVLFLNLKLDLLVQAKHQAGEVISVSIHVKETEIRHVMHSFSLLSSTESDRWISWVYSPASTKVLLSHFC